MIGVVQGSATFNAKGAIGSCFLLTRKKPRATKFHFTFYLFFIYIYGYIDRNCKKKIQCLLPYTVAHTSPFKKMYPVSNN